MKSRLPLLMLAVLGCGAAQADEGGVSFWAPGTYGSLAAAPGTAGWSWSGAYLYASADAAGDKSFPRGGRIDAGLDGRVSMAFVGPTYTFENPVLGGQAAMGVTVALGRSEAGVGATFTGPAGATLAGRIEDDRTMVGDLFPLATLKWNRGAHNFMTYAMGDIPVGAYDPDRLANLGLGHGAIDAGGAYTYFNPATGWEFSATSGLTYNFENPDTDYQSGVDFHVDLGASYFLSENLHAGVVGYAYQQISGDSGSGAKLGDFESRVYGIGPQIGYLFPAGRAVGYLNLKAYTEWGAQNRPEGWNLWLTLAFSPAAKK